MGKTPVITRAGAAPPNSDLGLYPEPREGMEIHLDLNFTRAIV